MKPSLVFLGLAIVGLAIVLGGSGVSPAIPSTASGQLQTGALTVSQILSPDTVPITVIAAPGPGKLVVVDSVIFQLVAGATPYSGSGIDLLTEWGGGAGFFVAEACASQIFTSASNAFCSTPVEGITSALASSGAVNRPIIVTSTGPVTGGNGTISYWLQYRVLSGF